MSQRLNARDSKRCQVSTGQDTGQCRTLTMSAAKLRLKRTVARILLWSKRLWQHAPQTFCCSVYGDLERLAKWAIRWRRKLRSRKRRKTVTEPISVKQELCDPLKTDSTDMPQNCIVTVTDERLTECDFSAIERSDSEHEYDVFIAHGEGEKDLAFEILNLLEKRSFSCCLEDRDLRPERYICEEIARAVERSRRVVLLLSREFLETGLCIHKLQLSLNAMFDSQRALIVPVLVDIKEEEVPGCLRNLSIVDRQGDPNHQRKLLAILRGPEKKVLELMPVGNVSHGLAWSYFYYLKLTLRDLVERIENWCNRKGRDSDCLDVRMPRKFYILVPVSCFCPSTLEEADPTCKIQFGGHLDSVYQTSAGSVDRVYKHSVWSIRCENGKTLQFVGEYCKVIDTLYKMECEGNAGVDARQRSLQRDDFLRTLDKLLKVNHYDTVTRLLSFQDGMDEEGNVTPLSDILTPLVEKDRQPPGD